MAQGQGPVSAGDPAFERGVRAMHRLPTPALSHALFGARARVVAGELSARDAAAYVSGLLIASEWADARALVAPAETVRIVGEPALAALHAACAAHVGRPVQPLDVRDVQVSAWRALAKEGLGS